MAIAFREVKQRLFDFAGLTGDATYLWPRWIYLRVLAICLISTFLGYGFYAEALYGTRGIAPAADYLRAAFPESHGWAGWAKAPTLLWFDSGDGMLDGLSWGGLLAAFCLLLNFYPRAALAVSWLCLHSLALGARGLPMTQIDTALLEMAFLGFFLAPAGSRPGRGVQSPPAPGMILLLRWLAFRMMFTSGTMKFFGDSLWRDFQAMDVMYLSAPFPTILAYVLHNFPHGWHVLEILFMIAAEILAPLLALAGRRPRLLAFWVWSIFQLVIWFSSNFCCLNLLSLGVGACLLDDQMLGGEKIIAEHRKPSRRTWRNFFAHGILAAYAFATAVLFLPAVGIPLGKLPKWLSAPAVQFQEKFRSANLYALYAHVPKERQLLEFAGSSDGGRTWKVYEFRFLIQKTDRLAGLVAPYFPRFDAIFQLIQFDLDSPDIYPVIYRIARGLLQNDPLITGLFRDNPFAQSPPSLIAFPVSRMTYTNFEGLRETGQYWHKEYLRDVAPPVFEDPQTGELKSIQAFHP